MRQLEHLSHPIVVASSPWMTREIATNAFFTFLAVLVAAIIANQQQRSSEARDAVSRSGDEQRRLHRSVLHVSGTLERLEATLTEVETAIEEKRDPLLLPSLEQITGLKADIFDALRLTGAEADSFESTLTSVELCAHLVIQYLVGINDAARRTETLRRVGPTLLQLIEQTRAASTAARQRLGDAERHLSAQMQRQ